MQSEHPPEPQSVIQEGQPVTLPVQCPSWVFLQSPDEPKVQLVQAPKLGPEGPGLGAEQSVCPIILTHSLFNSGLQYTSLFSGFTPLQDPDP